MTVNPDLDKSGPESGDTYRTTRRFPYPGSPRLFSEMNPRSTSISRGPAFPDCLDLRVRGYPGSSALCAVTFFGVRWEAMVTGKLSFDSVPDRDGFWRLEGMKGDTRPWTGSQNSWRADRGAVDSLEAGKRWLVLRSTPVGLHEDDKKEKVTKNEKDHCTGNGVR
jgi:hypothetical protein